MRRRIQIQPDNIGRLGLKVRIVRGHVALDPMRLQSVLAPDSRHHHVADVQVSAELARAPVRRAIARRTARRLQDPRFELRREYRGDLAQVPAVEPRDPLLDESLVPAGDKAAAALDPFGHFIPRMAFGQQQDQPRSSGIFRPIRSAVRNVSMGVRHICSRV